MSPGALCGDHRVDEEHVFVWNAKADYWRIARRETAERRWPKRIIRCCRCKRPAAQVDMHFPYGNYNFCDKHSSRGNRRPPQFKAGQKVDITGGVESAEFVRNLRDSD